ncbi:F-box protein CPR1-like [Lycium ferocissimum]|uniref:F-box protein CPR1-like n=1 Tax=Lycium ferocissimum TaxID=112874 RepID=UPI002815E590|nr:F-box protein CPR1-like [Lycium ferocissimum]
MSTFPLDIVSEILCRLPVKCVLRCRCVSKCWLTLIDSPEFSKLHVNYSLKLKTTNSNLFLILRKVDYNGHGKRCFYSLHFDNLNSRVVTPKELTNPLMSYEFNTKILGSCNGLLLISNTVNDIALWNPSTGKHKKLPILGIGENHVHVSFGFGYDVVNNDYKVVRIVQFSGSEKGSFHSDVKVYSLKSSCWRGVDEQLPYFLQYVDQPGTYLNGSLHWFASAKMEIPENNLELLIVAFDLGTEKWRLVPPPRYMSFNVNLVLLGGSLCVYKTYLIDSYDDWGNVDLVVDHVDIWEMKEYGVKDSWTMVASLEQPDKQIGCTVVPLAYSKNGEEILVELDNRRFVWTSIAGDSIKIVDIEIGALRGFLHFNSYVYLGSLAHLSSNDDTSDRYNQDKGGKKKALKKRGDDFLSKGFKLKL